MIHRKALIHLVATLIFIALASNTFAGNWDDRLTALEELVATQQSTIDAQQVTIDSLSAQLAAVQANPVFDLGAFVSVDYNDINAVVGPHVIFEGANVHVRSGAGSISDGDGAQSQQMNGLGNLIIGYNNLPRTQEYTLQPGDRSGSHNLVIGFGNRFSSFSGLVHGWSNSVMDEYSAIIAGDVNTVSGGYSAIIGGLLNNLTGSEGTIVGGFGNTSAGIYSTVIGGKSNTSSGFYSTVTGGENNVASGTASSVSGGLSRQALGDHDWTAGSLWENY